jgi:hypothetical protein
METVEYTETTIENRKVKLSLPDVVKMVIVKLTHRLRDVKMYDSEPYLDTSDNGESVTVEINGLDDIIELDGDFQNELKNDVLEAMTQMTNNKEKV